MNKPIISKKLLKRVLKYDWWKYFFILLAVPLISYYCSYFKNRIKPEEDIQIFYMSKLKTDSTLKTDIYNEFKDKVASLTFYKPIDNDSMFDEALINQGYGNSDLLILTEDAIKDGNLQYTVKFDQQLIDRFSTIKPDCEFYQKNDEFYGIKIMDRQNDAYNTSMFSTHFEKDKNYYLLFSKESYNVGKYGKNSAHEEAFQIAETLLRNNG